MWVPSVESRGGGGDCYLHHSKLASILCWGCANKQLHCMNCELCCSESEWVARKLVLSLKHYLTSSLLLTSVEQTLDLHQEYRVCGCPHSNTSSVKTGIMNNNYKGDCFIYHISCRHFQKTKSYRLMNAQQQNETVPIQNWRTCKIAVSSTASSPSYIISPHTLLFRIPALSPPTGEPTLC